MNPSKKYGYCLFFFLCGFFFNGIVLPAEAASLNLWKQPFCSQITDFVKAVSSKTNPHYISPENRVAVFDMDGTLITERPTYFEVQLALHYLKRKISQTPPLIRNPLYQAIDRNDQDYIEEHGKEIMAAYFENRTWEDLTQETQSFYKNAVNEKFGCEHSNLAYKPMLQLMNYLKKKGFQNYIVSTSLLPIAREIGRTSFQLPPENIIGSVPTFSLEEGKGMGQARFGENYFLPYTSEEGKSLRIIEQIGKEPILAFGNSSGDKAMMFLTNANSKSKIILLLDHNDSREDIYRKESMLKLAEEKGWVVVPMSKAFKEVFVDCER